MQTIIKKYIFYTLLAPICSSALVFARQCNGSQPKKELENGYQCPPGYEVCSEQGTEGRQVCQMCEEGYYQPYRNDATRQCNAMTKCNEDTHNTVLDQPGSHLQDATCKCLPGYHFPPGVSQACVDNSVCPPGLGQSPSQDGKCVVCLPGTFSNRNDQIQLCQSATRCEDNMQCTVVESTPIADTTCSQPVKDIVMCAILFPRNITMTKRNDISMQTTSSTVPSGASHSNALQIGLGLGLGVPSLILIIIVVCLVICRRRGGNSMSNGCQTSIKNDIVSDEQLAEVSKIVGGNWPMLSSVLGYSKEYEKDNFCHGTNKLPVICSRMLTKWKLDHKEAATVVKLIEALGHAGIEKSYYQKIFPDYFDETVV